MATGMQTSLQRCEICENNISRRYCIDCEQCFCKACEEFHLKSNSCRNHIFQDFGQINPEDKKIKCKEHKENTTYYCATCFMLVCKICLPDKHKKHDFYLASEAAFTLKKDLKGTIEHMETVVESIEQQVIELKNENIQFRLLNGRVEQEIIRKGNDLKSLVDKIVSDRVELLTNEALKNLQNKSGEERFLKDAQERGELVISKLTNAVENQEDSILLNSNEMIQKTIQSMPEIGKSVVQWPNISFEEGSLSENMLTQMIGNVVISKKRTTEQAKKAFQKAKLLTDIVRWYCIEENKGEKWLVKYPPEVNLILETALKDQKTVVSFNDQNGYKYIVDFNSYEVYPENDHTFKNQVLRRSKLVDPAFELPLYWDKHEDEEILKKVQLDPTDQEYQDVSKKFTVTAAGIQVSIIKIERIQNISMYQQFVAKKKLIDATNPKTVINERQLWHGSHPDAIEYVNRYGFNRSFIGKQMDLYGRGVYFSIDVNVQIRDFYSPPDTNGHKRMYLCRVLTGESCLGSSGLKILPIKHNAADSFIQYDSTTNDVDNPIFFVIFHDSQAFPEYLITFKRG